MSSLIQPIIAEGQFLNAHTASPRWLFWDFVSLHGPPDKIAILARAAVHSKQEKTALWKILLF
jgi:hypothetical protein